jgi:predicted ATPase
MSRIKIKNFGPIKEGFTDNDGWLEVKKVTMFIGNQGSGKSTVAKLISTFTWIEKAIVRGDYDIKWFSTKNRLKNQYLTYHRLENYISSGGDLFDKTEIEYIGDAYQMKYEKGSLIISEIAKGKYPLPQIMYVPAERNFVANVKSPKELRLTSDSLKEFVAEFNKAKNELKGPMILPINEVAVEYNKFNDIVYIKGNDYKIKITEASSGFQSLVPLYLVSWFLANSVKKQSKISKEPMNDDERERFKKGVADIWSNVNLTDEQRRVALSVLSSKFNKTAFLNIVEEPEQNLFPTSQWEILKSLLEYNNMNKGNKLIMTTHSPYLINYISLAVKAYDLKGKVITDDLKNRLNAIVPLNSTVNPKELVIYELDETDGSIKKLGNFEGIPSDKNFLNKSIASGNHQFDSLIEIEEEL